MGSPITTTIDNNPADLLNSLAAASDPSNQALIAETVYVSNIVLNPGAASLTPSQIQLMFDNNPDLNSTSISLDGKSLIQNSLDQFDETDHQDYGSRFFISDNLNADDSPSDIAYFRIVDDKTKSICYFPSDKSAFQQPGISKNKFRQFIVMNTQDVSAERFQIVENSDDFSLNFFEGKKPEFLPIMGILKNSKENPWNINMLILWSELMRGSQLAKLGLIMQLYIDGITYYGYPINFQRSKAAGTDFIINFSMAFVIRNKYASYQKSSKIIQFEQQVRKIVDDRNKELSKPIATSVKVVTP